VFWTFCLYPAFAFQNETKPGFSACFVLVKISNGAYALHRREGTLFARNNLANRIVGFNFEPKFLPIGDFGDRLDETALNINFEISYGQNLTAHFNVLCGSPSFVEAQNRRADAFISPRQIVSSTAS
jgi:hypothetical protein